jgi:hypothetical protein
MARKSRPLGVTVLALIQFVSGLQMLASALICFALASIVSSPEVQSQLTDSSWLIENAGTLLTILGVVFLVLAILSFQLTRGYLRGYRWARTRGRKVATFAALVAVLNIMLMPARVDPGSPWLTLLFNIMIILYLGRRRIKAYFVH